MRKILAVALKEMRQTLRDPLSLIVLLGIPTFMLVLFGYAISFDVRDVPLGVEDRDFSASSRRLVDAFVASRYFQLAVTFAPEGDLAQATEERQAAAILVIPRGFEEALLAGRQADVQLIVDGADANTATTVLGYADAIVAAANAERRRRSGAGLGLAGRPPAAISFRPRVWYNPELRSSHFLVPGLIGTILMLTAVLSTALSVVREKERGTMEQLRVAPLRTFQLIVGKTVLYLLVSLLATVIILAAARLLFGVVVEGSYADLFLSTLLYLVGALGFGLLISSAATSQALAFQLGVLTSLLPAMLLSGFIFPISSMPQALQWVTYAVPARYYLVVLRGIILKGAGLGTYGREMTWLALYTLIVLVVASVRLARRGG